MDAVRALLLTDVIESTAMAERLGDAAMAEVWRAHDRAARDLLPKFSGREIDKTDGMLLIFESVSDALRYATAYHRVLTTLPVPLAARAGLHFGPVMLSVNSPDDVLRGAKPLEVDGLAKPIVARVMALAAGGQTLLTRDALDGLEADVRARARSHGHWMLKGVSEPVELFDAAEDRVTSAKPVFSDKATPVAHRSGRWVPLSEFPGNLPNTVTPLVGREPEVVEIRTRVRATPLLTLVGTGGVGKTRLALEAASTLQGQFADGIWLVELAPLSDPMLVPNAIARVIGLRENAEQTITDTLLDAMRHRDALLLLDNCEHLVTACASLAERIVQRCPRIRILATSREPLAIGGETLLHIPPLRTLGANEASDPQLLLTSPAERLFILRATAAAPGFRVTPETAPAVARLCRQLDGIPLALELAASRVRSLGVQAIAERLGDRFALLTHGSRTALPRHQTLRAMVDWSHGLLNDVEQALFRRLSVFSDGWTLDAAEAVCADAIVPPDQVLNLLSQLVDKSLVACDGAIDSQRYRMLETIRQYASEHLRAAGEDVQLHQRFLQHMLVFAETMRRPLVLQDRETRWARQVDGELGNLRAALQLAQQPDSADFGLRIVSSLHRYWYQAMLWRETVERIERLLAAAAAHGGEPTPAQALGCYVAGMLATNYDPVAGRRLCNEGLVRSRGIAFEEGIAKCTMWLAHLDARRRDPATRELFSTCLTLGPRIPDDLERAQFLMLTLVCLAEFEALMHREEEAEAAIEECERVNDAIGGVYLFRGHCRALLGTLATRRGNLSQAARSLSESLVFYRAIGSTFDVAGSLVQQGFLALRLGRPRDALALFKESLPMHGTYTQSPWVTRSLAHLTIALAACQCWDAAVRLAGSLGLKTDAAEAQPVTPSVISGAVAQAYEQALADALRALGPGRVQSELGAGWSMTREEAIALALSIQPAES